MKPGRPQQPDAVVEGRPELPLAADDREAVAELLADLLLAQLEAAEDVA